MAALMVIGSGNAALAFGPSGDGGFGGFGSGIESSFQGGLRFCKSFSSGLKDILLFFKILPAAGRDLTLHIENMVLTDLQ